MRQNLRPHIVAAAISYVPGNDADWCEEIDPEKTCSGSFSFGAPVSFKKGPGARRVASGPINLC